MGPATNTAASPAQSILDNISTGVLLLDAGLRIRYANFGAEVLLQTSARRLAGESPDQVAGFGRGLLQRLRESVRTGHPFTEHGVVLALPGGRTVTVDCTVSPMQEPGAGEELLVEMLPVGHLQRMTKEQRLLAQNQAAHGLVRGLAHEIKNPLGGIRGAAQLLERELPSPELAEYTRIIIEEADRLQALVDRMLGPRQLPQPRWVNIHQVLERVRQLVAAEAPPSIRIRRDYDPAIPELRADPDQLIQVFLNLVRNAVEALGGQGQITLRTRVQRQVTIGSRRHRLVLVAEVADNGPGVPAEVGQDIFYPMVTGRPEGTGMGLAIAQSLVNRHGGLIEYESEPGHTVFRILLPLERKHEQS